MSAKKVSEMLQLSKLTDMIRKQEKKEKCCKAWIVVLCVLAGLVLLTGVGYVVYRYFWCREDDYDLYDDLDSYYEDDEDEEELGEEDFAE